MTLLLFYYEKLRMFFFSSAKSLIATGWLFLFTIYLLIQYTIAIITHFHVNMKKMGTSFRVILEGGYELCRV